MLSVTIWIVCRQSPGVWAYRNKCTWTHILTESFHSDYRALSQNKHKQALKKKSCTNWSQSLKWCKDCAGLHLLWQGYNLQPQTKCTRSVHPQPAHRKGMSLACKVEFKGSSRCCSNSSYLKSPRLLLKNKKSCLLIFLNTFLPWVCCTTAKTRGVRSVWAQHRLITVTLKKGSKPLKAFFARRHH